MQKASLSKMSLKVIAKCLLLIAAGFPPPGVHAQRAQDERITVQSISSRSLSNGTVVSCGRAFRGCGEQHPSWARSQGQAAW